MIDIYASMLRAFVSAIILALFGYLKNKESESFEPGKIFATMFTAAVVAYVYVMYQVPLELGDEMVSVLLTQTGAIALFERVFKWIWRSYIVKLLPKE